jgi:hypothetical protein
LVCTKPRTWTIAGDLPCRPPLERAERATLLELRCLHHLGKEYNYGKTTEDAIIPSFVT